MRSKQRRAELSVGIEEFGDGLVFKNACEFQRWAVLSRPIVLHKRAQRPSHAGDERGFYDDDAEVILEGLSIPTPVRAPVLRDGRDACFCQLAGPLRFSVLNQRVECVKSFADIVGMKEYRLAFDGFAVQGQRDRSALGQEGSPRVLLNDGFVDMDAESVFRIQK
jgi:hypothetical protein